jgi:DNA excision repair protein ERCC-2
LPSVEEVFKEAKIEPRPGQMEVAQQLADLIAGGKRVLLTAPTGWGKTLVVLAALHASDSLPAAWLVRALALGEHIAEEAAKMKLFTYIAGGREKTCLLWERLEDATHDLCRYARYKCPYARLPPTPPIVTDWSEMVKRARAGRWCAYFAQEMVPSDLVVQNYERALRRPVRAYVIDECHNLALPEEKTVTLARLAESVAAIRAYASERLRSKLEALVRHILVRDGDLDARLILNEEGIEELKRVYAELLVENPERAAALRPLITLVNATAAYVEAERISIFRPRRVLKFRPAVLLTATPLPLPTEVDTEINIEWSVRARGIIVTDVSSKFDEFDSKMALNYKKLLINLAKKFRRILVFAASERVARELRSWVNYEETTPPPDWEGLLMLRARGRFAEGVNMPAECVIMAGAPYLPPEVSDRLARVYKMQGVENPTRLAIDGSMLAATVQALGRAWREPSKPPLVVLADSRYARYEEQLRKMLDIEELELENI